jgi:hypothetical protein
MDELWRRLEALFHDCAGIPPALRSDYLDVRCAGEPHLRSEVEELLAASNDSEGFVEEIIRRVVDEQVPGCGCGRSAPSMRTQITSMANFVARPVCDRRVRPGPLFYPHSTRSLSVAPMHVGVRCFRP